MPTTNTKSNTTGTTPTTNSSTTIDTAIPQQALFGETPKVSKSKRRKLYTLSFVAPPLAVARLCKNTQRTDRNEIITLNVILTVCGIVPGIVHAVAVVHHETKGQDGKSHQHDDHYNRKRINDYYRHDYNKNSNSFSGTRGGIKISKLGGGKSSKGNKNKENKKTMQSRESEEELQELLRNVRHVSSNRKLTMIPEQSETSSEASVPVVAGNTGSRLSFGGVGGALPVEMSSGTKTSGKEMGSAASKATIPTTSTNTVATQQQVTDKIEKSRGRLTKSDRDNNGNGKSKSSQQPQHQQSHANWASKDYNPLDKQRRELPDFPWPPPSAVSAATAVVAPTKAPLHSETRHTLKRRSSSSIRSRRDADESESEALIATIPTETLIDILRRRDDYSNYLSSLLLSSSSSSNYYNNHNLHHHHHLGGVGGTGGSVHGGTASAAASIRRKMSRDSLRSFRSSYSDFPHPHPHSHHSHYYRDRDRDRDFDYDNNKWDDWDDGSSLSSMPIMPVMMGRM